MQREKFSSRLGFLLISAGCAIGLGNIYRFPYITGRYGGAAFVLVYLFFLLILGLPIMVMEFSVGRASQKSAASSFKVLEPKGTFWHLHGYISIIGNYLLMMFYTTIGGLLLAYFFQMLAGRFHGLDPAAVTEHYQAMMANPVSLTFWMVVVVVLGFSVCSMGLQNGVERINKIMMASLLVMMILLAVRSVTLEGASAGLTFYLKPDFGKMMEYGFSEVVFAAMGQAFFTLSLGIGALAIFGSYIEKDHSLTGEAIHVTVLDTVVAFLAGLITFPACFAFGVQPDSGPQLIFLTLPNIFNHMIGGRIWGALFFLCMTFAAFTTIIAVFENIVSYGMDLRGWSRKKSVIINVILVILLSMPCVLGSNILSGIQPMGPGSSIMDLEDFIVSNNLLPLGSLVYLLFCTSRYGWGWKNFIQEADAGNGIKFPKWTRIYMSYILPLIVLYIFIKGYIG